jgi:hypothetical protein
MSSQATRTNLSNQFIRQFPVPIDRDFVFDTTDQRENYLTNPATSGIAYSGMIVADNEKKKAYILTVNAQSELTWEEIGASTVGDLFTGSGIMVKTADDSYRVASLSQGANIDITNSSGIIGDPVIGLSASLTGLNSIGVTGQGISVSGNSTFYNNVNVTGDLTLGGILTVAGSTFENNTITLINLDATSGNFDSLTVGSNQTHVSLSGHGHVWDDINIVGSDFCDNVGSCLTTELNFTNGIASVFDNNQLTIQLTGTANLLHNNLNTASAGLAYKKTDGSFTTKLIVPTGNYPGNIQISNYNISTPTNIGLSLNTTLSGLSSITTKDLAVTGTLGAEDVTVSGNLYILGTSVVANVTTIEVQDPSIRIGAPSGESLQEGDTFDRGIEFVYPTGEAGTVVATTGFFGYDYSEKLFTFMPVLTSSTPGIYGGNLGTIKIGKLWATGTIGGTSSVRAKIEYCTIDGGSPGA